MENKNKLHKKSLKERYDKEYLWYDKTRSSWMKGYTGSVEQEIILSNLDEGLILEIGTGTGRYAALLKKKNYIGIDLNRRMLTVAKERTSGVFIVAEAEALPFREGVFDNVICSRTFRFIQNPLKTLTEAHRILKKDGKCVISVDFLRDFFGYKIAQSIFGKYPYETHYRKYELTELYEKARLRIVHEEMPFTLPETFYQRLPRWFWKFVRKTDNVLKRTGKGWLIVIIGKRS